MGKKHLTSFLFLFTILLCRAQDIIDIQIDSVHCQDSDCYFLNFSEDCLYSCYFLKLEYGCDLYHNVIDCSIETELNSETTQPNLLHLDKLTKIEDYENWVSSLNLASTFSTDNSRYEEHYQSINNKNGVLLTKRYDLPDTIPSRTYDKVYQINPIRINNDFLIAGLVDSDYGEIDYLIFPDKVKNAIMHSNMNSRKLSFPTTIPIEIDESAYKRIFGTYKVRNSGAKKILTTSISQTPILKGSYDEIIIQFPFIITKLNNRVSILNQDFEKISPKNLKAAYPNFGNIQLIDRNQIRWLTAEGSIIDTMPLITRILDCGNNPWTEKTIQKNNNEFIELIKYYDGFSYPEKGKLDTCSFNLNRNVESIKYLNNLSSKTFYLDCFRQYYCLPTDQYYFRTQENTEGIFVRINEKEEKIKAIWSNDSLASDEKRKLIALARDSLSLTFRDEILFEGKFEEMKLTGYNHPIIFKKDGLFGVYPFMEEGRYISIKPYVGNLAEVTFSNKKTGWIDLEGIEIR